MNLCRVRCLRIVAFLIIMQFAIPQLSKSEEKLHYEYTGDRKLRSEDVVESCMPAICVFTDKSTGQAIGSGVIVNPAGVVITNAHIVTACMELTLGARTYDGIELVIDGILTYDLDNDWVTLKIHPEYGKQSKLNYVKIGKLSKVRLGEAVVAIGHPKGLEFTNTPGTIGNLKRKTDYCPMPLIQHSAIIAGGNSGGGLFVLTGGLIGINTMRISDETMFGYTDQSAYSFAIPIDSILLPTDTSHIIGLDCFCRYTDLLNRSKSGWTTWESLSYDAINLTSYCPNFTDAILFLLQCEFELGNYQKCVELSYTLEMMQPENLKGSYFRGMAWARVGLLDSARCIYKNLAPRSAELAQGLLAEIILWSAYSIDISEDLSSSEMALEEIFKEIFDESLDSLTDSLPFQLSPLEQSIYDKYGMDGINVYNLIDGEKTAQEILDETGLSEEYLVSILEFMDAEGIISLEKPEAYGTTYTADYGMAAIDSLAIRLTLSDLDYYLRNTCRNWDRAANILEELILWEVDSSYLEADYINLSLIYSMQGYYMAADSLLTVLVENWNTSDYLVYNNRANARLSLNKLDEAEVDMRKALELYSENCLAEGYTDEECAISSLPYKAGLAEILFWLGRSDESRALFDEIVMLDQRWKEECVLYEGFIRSEDETKQCEEWRRSMIGE